VSEALVGGASSFAAICREAKGAFPTEVAHSLTRLGHPVKSAPSSADEDGSGSPWEPWWPEPSPVDYEWRFTARTAQELATVAVHLTKGRILCLGTPTVFSLLASWGADVLLVDRNSLLRTVFDSVVLNKVLITDIDAFVNSSSLGVFDAVILDPPWYPQHLMRWLSAATRLARPQAPILFPFFRELVHPPAPNVKPSSQG
jgi:hypothetical protein